MSDPCTCDTMRTGCLVHPGERDNEPLFDSLVEWTHRGRAYAAHIGPSDSARSDVTEPDRTNDPLFDAEGEEPRHGR
jgi:hypothetical protein